MIVIKIKTWSDYKKQFLDWVKEPRQKRCISYVDATDIYIQEGLIKELPKSLNTLNIGKDVENKILNMACEIVHNSCNRVIEVIKDCQPKI